METTAAYLDDDSENDNSMYSLYHTHHISHVIKRNILCTIIKIIAWKKCLAVKYIFFLNLVHVLSKQDQQIYVYSAAVYLFTFRILCSEPVMLAIIGILNSSRCFLPCPFILGKVYNPKDMKHKNLEVTLVFKTVLQSYTCV